MKSKIIVSIVSIFLILCLNVSAYAHGGKTDSNGGHTDSSTGEYHYHHGYPAHSHPGGVCPYDYNDATDHSSGSSSSSSYDTVYPSTIITADDYTRGYNKGHDEGYDEGYEEGYNQGHSDGYLDGVTKDDNTSYEQGFDEGYMDGHTDGYAEGRRDGYERGYAAKPTVPTSIIVVLVLLAVIVLLMALVIKFKQNRIEKITSDNERADEKISNAFSSFEADVRNHYGDNYLLEISGAPSDAYIGEDGCPCIGSTKICKWGSAYTFYVNNHSRTEVFHDYSCHYSQNCIAVHAYHIKNQLRHLRPCGICNPSVPDVEWIDKYLNNISIIEEHVLKKDTDK